MENAKCEVDRCVNDATYVTSIVDELDDTRGESRDTFARFDVYDNVHVCDAHIASSMRHDIDMSYDANKETCYMSDVLAIVVRRIA